MSKEKDWMKKRLGMITASELGQITSASGKIIDGNLSYIRAKRWERTHGFSHPVSSRPMEIGNEQEPYIYSWCKKNLGLGEWFLYSKNLPEIPFWVSPECPLGASPDAFTDDEETVFEFKTLVGATSIEFFGDEHTSYEEKKNVVWKDHGDQLIGQFLSNPKVEEIVLVKYIYQDDDIEKDTDSVDAPWRGIVFRFKREDFSASIAEMRDRVILFDAMIDSGLNPSDFKKGEWRVDENGKLSKK